MNNAPTCQPANSQTRKLGLMGGTFDPIHIGHLILAEQAFEELQLDKVLFVTAANPPHKMGQVVTAAVHRHEMMCLGISGNNRFEPSTIEMDRTGPSYTVDTIREILRLESGAACVYLLIGADEAADLMSWRNPYGIQELATVVVANRPGHDVSESIRALPEEFARNVAPLSMPGVDVSSTDLRERVRTGRSIRYLVPDSVEHYIIERGLYG